MLAPVILEILLLDLLTASVFRSPDATMLPQVQTIADRAALVVSSGFILAILTAGILLITSTTFEVRYTAQDLAPRLLVEFVMSAFSVPLCSALIGIANAVMAAMAGDAVPTDPAAEGPTTKAINMVPRSCRLGSPTSPTPWSPSSSAY